ncbi:hypothetical protein Plo01_21900 [Planobispora longispora]|uniref:Acyltransferase 3 domain-containing protein n=1 Tax=Planobispora longispora TaxID=28887 RepID=A0A8J3RG97_9ACTN|nr:acyltransferase [Planobispora longispora]GIH75761.1 hypothetical protein Plo01_21900 [Planobispora longispora]
MPTTEIGTPEVPLPRDGAGTSPGRGDPREDRRGDGARLAWLDALRGVAAGMVLVSHTLPWFAPALSPSWIGLGVCGVLIFFLVSGYIIPASLERRGCVRSFWIGRLFRLYPLYLLAIVVALAMAPIVPVNRGADPIAHITMLMTTVGSARIVDPMWTLSYEMIFYLLVTALFVTGAHRGSGPFAVGFMVLSLGVGVTLPNGLLPDSAPLVSLVAVVIGLACVLGGRLRTAGALVLGATAVVLVALGPVDPWLGPAILAVMFAGTAIRRWEQGRASAMWCVLIVVIILCAAPMVCFPASGSTRPAKWIPAVLVAAAVFAVGMALRHRRVPRLLSGFGMISYSVYLLHYPLLLLFVEVLGAPRLLPGPLPALLAALYLAALLGVCVLTYRYVELPMQRLGRWLAREAPPVEGREAPQVKGSV